MHQVGVVRSHPMDALGVVPYLSPLVKPGKAAASYSKKYRHIRFLERSHFANDPLSIVAAIDSNLDPGVLCFFAHFLSFLLVLLFYCNKLYLL